METAKVPKNSKQFFHFLEVDFYFVTKELHEDPFEPVNSLRSAGRNLLSVPSSRLEGHRVFSVRAPQPWDDLPEELANFKISLKTFFFFFFTENPFL